MYLALAAIPTVRVNAKQQDVTGFHSEFRVAYAYVKLTYSRDAPYPRRVFMKLYPNSIGL